jgi:hypothetical protein
MHAGHAEDHKPQDNGNARQGSLPPMHAADDRRASMASTTPGVATGASSSGQDLQVSAAGGAAGGAQAGTVKAPSSRGSRPPSNPMSRLALLSTDSGELPLNRAVQFLLEL